MTNSQASEILDLLLKEKSIDEIFLILDTVDADCRHWLYSEFMARAGHARIIG